VTKRLNKRHLVIAAKSAVQIATLLFIRSTLRIARAYQFTLAGTDTCIATLLSHCKHACLLFQQVNMVI